MNRQPAICRLLGPFFFLRVFAGSVIPKLWVHARFVSATSRGHLLRLLLFARNIALGRGGGHARGGENFVVKPKSCPTAVAGPLGSLELFMA